MYNTYPQNQNYGPQHNGYGYAPMQQPMPMQAAPVAQSSSASKGLLMVAGIAVVGAAAFGGVYLMNSSSQPEQTAASQPSTVFNIPSEINIPGLNTNSDPASPVVVNNPAPVRVVTPSAPRTVNAPAAVASAPAPVAGPVAQKPVEEPKKEEPKKEEPKKEEPKKEEPKKEEPKKEEPKKEEPKKEEPEEGRAEAGRLPRRPVAASTTK